METTKTQIPITLKGVMEKAISLAHQYAGRERNHRDSVESDEANEMGALIGHGVDERK